MRVKYSDACLKGVSKGYVIRQRRRKNRMLGTGYPTGVTIVGTCSGKDSFPWLRAKVFPNEYIMADLWSVSKYRATKVATLE